MQEFEATDPSGCVTIRWIDEQVDQVLIKPTWKTQLSDVAALEQALNETLSHWPHLEVPRDDRERRFVHTTLTPERRSQLSRQTDVLLAELTALSERRVAERAAAPQQPTGDRSVDGHVTLFGGPGSCYLALTRPCAEHTAAASLSEAITTALIEWRPSAVPPPDPEQQRILTQLESIWAELGLPSDAGDTHGH